MRDRPCRCRVVPVYPWSSVSLLCNRTWHCLDSSCGRRVDAVFVLADAVFSPGWWSLEYRRRSNIPKVSGSSTTIRYVNSGDPGLPCPSGLILDWR
ncbi:hypothetical protein DPMN_151093 [Dreissena polymorpha]|uniref:Uncharacterized protein n=1 Tax=Dreissena polymorpha TaxID=45954 RepID=A0A9D4J6Y9_DREPO|nr:hypothetical protein DPMN_151093 [Dreissena polymorpha]